MATPIYNYTWAQGADLDIYFVYKEGPTGAEVPIDLTGYTLRMDITNPLSDNTVVYTFNTVEQTDPDEVTMNDPSLGSIHVVVPRELSLPPDGEVYTLMEGAPPVEVFNYDIFLRSPADKQKKILRGTITMERSYTLWL